MPPNPPSARSARAALTALTNLSEAALVAGQYRWDTSSLAYDPLAGLAENPADRCNRLLKPMVDRMLAPGATPGEPKSPRTAAQPDFIQTGRRPQVSGERPTFWGPAKAGKTAGAGTRRPGSNPGRRRLPVDPMAGSPGPVSDFTVDDSAVSGILGRHQRPLREPDRSGLPAPGNKVDFPRERRARRTRLTQPEESVAISAAGDAAGAVVPFDERVTAAPIRPPASGAADSGPWHAAGFSHPAVVPLNPRPMHHRLPDQLEVGDPVLGNSSLSSRGLKTPVALDPVVSADRLSAWTEPTVRVDAPPPPRRSPRADQAKPAAAQREAAGLKTGRDPARMADDPAQITGTGLPESSAGFSNLERLVHRWQADQKTAPHSGSAALQPASGPESTRSAVNAAEYSDRLPAPELSPARASEADFARRLENLLLRESRRHGIVLEDQ